MFDIVSDNKAAFEGNPSTTTFVYISVNRPYEFILPEHIASTTWHDQLSWNTAPWMQDQSIHSKFPSLSIGLYESDPVLSPSLLHP